MKSKNQKPEILVVAAEASSSLYAQRLMESYENEEIQPHFFGVGSRAMEQLGLESLGRAEDMAVVGIQEVVSHWAVIKGCFDRLVEEAKNRRPQVALLLDYPDFNLRLAKKLKSLNIPVIYYISPQVWAWRQSRVKIIKDRIDKMLVLFPFEKDFYEGHSVDVEFVGHPLLDELNPKYFEPSYFKQHREKYGLKENEKLLALMPGSRTSELKHHLSTQLETARLLQTRIPNLKTAILVAPTIDLEAFKASLPRTNFPLIVVQDDPLEMVHLADVVLCASGTATLLTGLMEKPMVIMYKMNPVTAWIARRFVKNTPFFGMINLVIGREVAKEFFQERANPRELGGALEELLNQGPFYRQQVQELKSAKVALGENGATVRVKNVLNSYIGRG